MPIVQATGMNIAYVENGDRAAPVILLIMGLGMQLTAWPDAFCEGLADRGFRVVRFDNRDVGLSTKLRSVGTMAVAAAFARALAGLPVKAPYLLADMARDTIGLMDALGIAQAHIVGASMGGMIAQIIAAEHAERALSLTSIMSSSGNPDLPRGDVRLLEALFWPRLVFNRERAIRRAMDFYRLIGSPGFPTSEEQLRAKVERSVDRCYYPAGMAHHLLAILASGSRVEMLGRIRAPTLVLHGADDPLMPVEAGKDTAAHIPGARLRIISGMGHDLAPGLAPILIDAIAEHCQAAARTSEPRYVARSTGRAR
jgi:pimeloyl-ACP methyl ester carboxylesterase